MKDITAEVAMAMRKDTLWPVDGFFALLSFLTRSSFDVSFWEGEEEWAVLRRDGNVVGYI